MTLSSTAIKQTNAAKGLSKQRHWPTCPLATAAELFLNNLLLKIWENLLVHYTLQCFKQGFCFKWHFLPFPSAVHSLHKESQRCCSVWTGISGRHFSGDTGGSQVRAAGTAAVTPLLRSEPTLSRQGNIKTWCKAQKRTKWEEMWHPPFLTSTFPNSTHSYQPHTDPGVHRHVLPTPGCLKYQVFTASPVPGSQCHWKSQRRDSY